MLRRYPQAIVLAVALAILLGCYAIAQPVAGGATGGIEGKIVLRDGTVIQGTIKALAFGVAGHSGFSPGRRDGMFRIQAEDGKHEIQPSDIRSIDLTWESTEASEVAPGWSIAKMTVLKRDGSQVSGKPTWKLHISQANVQVDKLNTEKVSEYPLDPSFHPEKLIKRAVFGPPLEQPEEEEPADVPEQPETEKPQEVPPAAEEEAVEQPAEEEAAEQPVEEVVPTAEEPEVEQPQPEEGPAPAAEEQPAQQPPEQPQEEAPEQPAEEEAAPPAEQPGAEQPEEEAPEQPAEEEPAPPTEKPAEQPTEPEIEPMPVQCTFAFVNLTPDDRKRVEETIKTYATDDEIEITGGEAEGTLMTFTLPDVGYMPALCHDIKYKHANGESKLLFEESGREVATSFRTAKITGKVTITVSFEIAPEAKLFYSPAPGEETAISPDEIEDGKVNMDVSLSPGQRYVYARTVLGEVVRCIKIDIYTGEKTEISQKAYQTHD